jgi:hypothetical protein
MTTVYTNGAFVQPIFYNGHWRWIVDSFEEDSFFDGDEVNTLETAYSESDLIQPYTLSWADVFNGDKSAKGSTLSDACELARKANYVYIVWNDVIYRTDTLMPVLLNSMTRMTRKDLE